MQKKILEAFNETHGNYYKSFEEIKSEYPVTDILDTFPFSYPTLLRLDEST